MLPLSKMQLVLCAVILILPALQSGAFLSATEGQIDCVQLIIQNGMTECTREGFDSFEGYDPYTCELKCDEEGKNRLPLPYGVCSGGKVHCTEKVKDILYQWDADVEDRKNKIKRKWCTAS
ncbi:uncharacterized protein LOC115324968 [Ixodes scapularis]|uniref:uncharacterized protein LOC115324968 n=1 Tax=Ixodes scapularis TaxID=6945 RepID=UPI001A9EA655|nr:uncharacterized protein LOC115324968 [Ixodes scapularis]